MNKYPSINKIKPHINLNFSLNIRPDNTNSTLLNSNGKLTCHPCSHHSSTEPGSSALHSHALNTKYIYKTHNHSKPWLLSTSHHTIVVQDIVMSSVQFPIEAKFKLRCYLANNRIKILQKWITSIISFHSKTCM